MAGKSLAGLLHNQNKDFILFGHSLGSRVINTCLNNLSVTDKCTIQEVYLLGGAVNKNRNAWHNGATIVHKRIYNFLSTNDKVLQILYKIAESSKLDFNDPIGRHCIDINKVTNIDVSHIISGHTVYHENLSDILK